MLEVTLLTEPKTMNGVTITPIYENGLLKYINLNGTSTDYTYVNLANKNFGEKSFNNNWNKDGSDLYKMSNGTTDISMTYDSNNNIIYCEFASGTTFNNVKIYPQVQLKTITDDTYEPFTNGASPNPDYLQPIEVIEGDLSIKVDNGLETTDEPYQEQIVPLDLKGNEVVKGDNIVIDKKGNVSLVKNWVKADLNDTNVNKKITEYDGLYWVGIKKPTNSKMLNNFVGYKMFVNCAYYSGTRDAVYSYQTRIGGLEWGIIVNSTDTIEDIRPKILGGYYYYELADPQIIDLGELPEPIKTFEGVNNIQALANLDTEIEVKYALDLKKYYDNKLAEISAQII